MSSCKILTFSLVHFTAALEGSSWAIGKQAAIATGCRGHQHSSEPEWIDNEKVILAIAKHAQSRKCPIAQRDETSPVMESDPRRRRRRKKMNVILRQLNVEIKTT
jgi:hypothetical protein